MAVSSSPISIGIPEKQGAFHLPTLLPVFPEYNFAPILGVKGVLLPSCNFVHFNLTTSLQFDGNANQVVYIIPSQNLVVLRTGLSPPRTMETEWDNSALPNTIMCGIKKDKQISVPQR